MKLNTNETCYQFFSTSANPTRIAILELLREGTKTLTEISEALNQEQSMISHNLKPLERCQFIFSERKKETPLLPHQRTATTDIQTLQFPRPEILPHKRTMPHQSWTGEKEKTGSINLAVFSTPSN